MNEEPILLRNFSKKCFKDSKLVESYKSEIIASIKKYSIIDDIEYDFDSFLKEHEIYRNVSYVYFKNGLVLSLNGQIVDLNKIKDEFAISQNLLHKTDLLSLSKRKIITIENLTTFNYFNDDDFIVIYLGGFLNSSRKDFLLKIASKFSQTEWYHFGDIDVGGFRILNDLRNRTHIPFKPFLMDLKTLQTYKSNCLKLTDNDKRNLLLMKSQQEYKQFYEVIDYMLKEDIKLEQESIEF